MNKIENPITGEPVAKEAAEYIGQLRTVRRNAKKAARSGNPAKRGPALKALVQVPGMIRAVYRQDAAKAASR